MQNITLIALLSFNSNFGDAYVTPISEKPLKFLILHLNNLQTMEAKTKTRITFIATAIPSVIILFSAIFKLIHAPIFAEAYVKSGIGEFLVPLAIAELVLLALFLFPKTFKVGFFLLCSYLGGAMMAHLANGDTNVFDSVFLLTLFWISAFLRDKNLFLSV